jgi:hypothetical protein
MIIRSEHEWLDLFKQHEASGLSAAQFCRDENLCTRYFSKRKRQLAWPAKKQVRSVKKKPTADFIKVSMSKPSTNFTLECGDLKLCWNQLPPTDWLIGFIKALK